MAKKSSVEKNNRRRRMVKKYRGQTLAAEGDQSKSFSNDGRAVRSSAEAVAAAAEFRACPDPQSLRAYRAATCGLSKIQNVAHGAERTREQGADPRRGQVKLVETSQERTE